MGPDKLKRLRSRIELKLLSFLNPLDRCKTVHPTDGTVQLRWHSSRIAVMPRFPNKELGQKIAKSHMRGPSQAGFDPSCKLS
jgi:hypothetical protein